MVTCKCITRTAAASCALAVLTAGPALAQQQQPPHDQHQQAQQSGQQQSSQRAQQSSGQQDPMTIVQDWPQVAQKATKEMMEKYGQPSGVTPTRLVWTKQSPFTEIIVINEAINHDFPKPHKDCLEHVVALNVPADKVGELAKFDGSIIVDRTRGRLSARCDSEAHNILALNLAHDIITGKKNVEQARQAYGEAAKKEMSGQKPDLAMKLQFQPDPQPGDSDVATIGPKAGQTSGEAQPAGAQQQPGQSEDAAHDEQRQPGQQEQQQPAPQQGAQ